MGNPLNAVSRAGDVIGDAISVIASKRERIIKSFINGFLLLIILGVFGCLDFATLKFNIEQLLSFSYWGTVFTKVVAGVCAFNIGLNILWDIELKKDKILKNAIKRYNHLNSKEYKHEDFSYFIQKVFNVEQKKQAYINHINRLIHLLNRVSRRKHRVLYSAEVPTNAENYDAEVKALKNIKAKNRYCKKRKELEFLKSDDYINKNIGNINVKYPWVDESLFELEIDGAEPKSKIKVKGNLALGRAKTSINVVLGMVAFSMFITAFRLELNQETFVSQVEAFWHYFLKCTEDVGIILWQTTRGMFKARKIISSELTQPFVCRIRVLEEYYKWRKENGVITEEEYKEIVNWNPPDDDVVEEVEMTKEEFEKYRKAEQ